jgi:hypothetical protein
MSSKKKTQKKKAQSRRTALIISHSGKRFWTTQAQFWQWIREGIIVKTGDYPLCGSFIREHQESFVVLSNTVLNLACPNHLCESLKSRRLGLTR